MRPEKDGRHRLRDDEEAILIASRWDFFKKKNWVLCRVDIDFMSVLCSFSSSKPHTESVALIKRTSLSLQAEKDLWCSCCGWIFIADDSAAFSATNQGCLVAFKRWCLGAFFIRDFGFIFKRTSWSALEIEIPNRHVEAV